MEGERILGGLAGGQLAVGTVVLAAVGGPLWAIGLFGGLAGFGIYKAVKG